MLNVQVLGSALCLVTVQSVLRQTAIISMKRNEVSSKHHADHDESKADAWHQNSGMQQPMR